MIVSETGPNIQTGLTSSSLCSQWGTGLKFVIFLPLPQNVKITDIALCYLFLLEFLLLLKGFLNT